MPLLHSVPLAQKYPISGYIKLPAALQPFVNLPIMDHVVVVAKPSGDVSGGLEHYREVGRAGALLLLRMRGGGIPAAAWSGKVKRPLGVPPRPCVLYWPLGSARNQPPGLAPRRRCPRMSGGGRPSLQ